MIKRFLSGLLSALMVLALVSCGGGTDQPAETTENNVPSEIHCTVTVKIDATDKKGDVTATATADGLISGKISASITAAAARFFSAVCIRLSLAVSLISPEYAGGSMLSSEL